MKQDEHYHYWEYAKGPFWVGLTYYSDFLGLGLTCSTGTRELDLHMKLELGPFSFDIGLSNAEWYKTN